MDGMLHGLCYFLLLVVIIFLIFNSPTEEFIWGSIVLSCRHRIIA